MGRLLNFTKPILGALAIIVILQMTGALSSASEFANTAVLKSGIMNAAPGKESDPREPLDYNFNIKTLPGEVIDFNQFKGKVLFINLWATWCGPCRVEMPSVQKLYDGLDHNKVQFIMLSLDRDDAVAKINKYATKNNFTFPIYIPSGSLPVQFQVSSIPTTFIIDRNGNIVSKKVGTTNFNTDRFKKYLEDLVVQ